MRAGRRSLSQASRSWRQLGRLFDLATELAFRKHRMAEGDARHQELCARDIASFRKQIDAMRDA